MFRLILLKLLPKNLVSRLVGWAASRSISKPAIRLFAAAYNINMDEAEKPLGAYPTLNQFFTRRLKSGLRPIAQADNPAVVVSPVDGRVDQFGHISGDTLIQAKGHEFTLSQLLNSEEEAKDFIDGYFMTIYLAPVDYHRIHHYIDGVISSFRYVPGTLYPVNNFSVARVPRLFAINERITTYVDTPYGKTAIVKVGATIVGKIKVAYDSIESNLGKDGEKKVYDPALPVKKGDDLGLFEMGSTVILLFQKDRFEPVSLHSGIRVKVGEMIGKGI